MLTTGMWVAAGDGEAVGSIVIPEDNDEPVLVARTLVSSTNDALIHVAAVSAGTGRAVEAVEDMAVSVGKGRPVAGVVVSDGNRKPVVSPADSASATGHTVVDTTIMSVVTEPILAGQSVTVAAQDVIE